MNVPPAVKGCELTHTACRWYVELIDESLNGDLLSKAPRLLQFLESAARCLDVAMGRRAIRKCERGGLH